VPSEMPPPSPLPTHEEDARRTPGLISRHLHLIPRFPNPHLTHLRFPCGVAGALFRKGSASALTARLAKSCRDPGSGCRRPSRELTAELYWVVFEKLDGFGLPWPRRFCPFGALSAKHTSSAQFSKSIIEGGVGSMGPESTQDGDTVDDRKRKAKRIEYPFAMESGGERF
jgi:hypothetical protein